MNVLVAGIGNIFLGDDGFGPEVAQRMLSRGTEGAAGSLVERQADVRVVDYGIRGMHLAYDLLDGVDALILVDTVPGGGSPGEVTVMQVGPDDLGEAQFDAHGMEPVSVLASLGSMGGEMPPTYVVGCQPADLSEGIGLSEAVAAAVDEAVALVDALISDRHLTGVPAGREA